MARIPMYMSINIVPQSLRQAVIATEDRRFYSHGAIDPSGIIRAAAVNLYSGETVEGGSTISQQVVKNVFLSHERTLSRKVQEVILAFLLEHYYSKDDILEIYLNTACLAPTPRASTKRAVPSTASAPTSCACPSRLCWPDCCRLRPIIIPWNTTTPPASGSKSSWLSWPSKAISLPARPRRPIATTWDSAETAAKQINPTSKEPGASAPGSLTFPQDGQSSFLLVK